MTELLRTRLEPEQEKEAAQMMSSDYPAYFRQEPDVLEVWSPPHMRASLCYVILRL